MSCTSNEVVILNCLALDFGSPEACEEQLTIAASCSADDQTAVQVLDDKAFGDQSETAASAAVSEGQCMRI